VAVCCQAGSGLPEKIGTFQIDLNCPLFFARQFLQQSLLSELDAHTGGTYGFIYQGKVAMEEHKTKVHEVAPQRLDPVTRELGNVLVLCVAQ